MSVCIRKMGPIYQPHIEAVGSTWAEYDHGKVPELARTITRNDANLATIIARKNPRRVLILASGRCREFTLSKIVDHTSQTTLVDIREAALKAAFRDLNSRQKEKVDLVQADLSLVSSIRYYQRVGEIVAGATTSPRATAGLNNFFLQELPGLFTVDPLAAFTEPADLILLIGTISPLFYDLILSAVNQASARFPSFSAHPFTPTLTAFREGVEKEHYRAYARMVEAHLSPGGAAYAVVYHQTRGDLLYSERYYNEAFAPALQVVPGALPHPIPEALPAQGEANFGFFLRTA